MANTALVLPSYLTLDPSGNFTISGTGTMTSLALAAAGTITWASRSKLTSGADGDLTLATNAGAMLSNLYIGPATTSGFKISFAGSTYTFARGDGSAATLSVGTLSATSVSGTSVTSSGGSVANSGNSSNVGLQLGSGASAARLDYTGTAAVYKMRDGSATEGRGWLLQGVYTVAKTNSYTVVAADSGTHFTNQGASGAITFTLPTPAQGLAYRFTATTAQTVNVTTPSGSVFMVGLTGATRTTSTQYAHLSIVCYDGSNWVAMGATGTWT